MEKINIDAADKEHVKEFPDGSRVVKLAINDMKVAHVIAKPGWKWSKYMKDSAGTESCETEHIGYIISGSLCVKMDDGSQQMDFKQGDLFHISPKHDAWVTSEEPCVMLDFHTHCHSP